VRGQRLERLLLPAADVDWSGLTWKQLDPQHQLWLGTVYEDWSSSSLMAWGVGESQFSVGVYPQYAWRWSGADWVESTTTTLTTAPQPHSLFLSFAAVVCGSRA
jgi:hypothetical protein